MVWDPRGGERWEGEGPPVDFHCKEKPRATAGKSKIPYLLSVS